jgi:hypothetical protein
MTRIMPNMPTQIYRLTLKGKNHGNILECVMTFRSTSMDMATEYAEHFLCPRLPQMVVKSIELLAAERMPQWPIESGMNEQILKDNGIRG